MLRCKNFPDFKGFEACHRGSRATGFFEVPKQSQWDAAIGEKPSRRFETDSRGRTNAVFSEIAASGLEGETSRCVRSRSPACLNATRLSYYLFYAS